MLSASARTTPAVGDGCCGQLGGRHRHLAEQLEPDVLRITRAVKAAPDPEGSLNPGKWV